MASEGQASLRFSVRDGRVAVQVELPDQVISLEVDENQLTAAFLRRAEGWSKAIGGRFRVSQPFRAVRDRRE